MAVLVLAWSAPLFAPYDPRLSSGRPLLSPGRDHLLGTNDIGQDVLSEWLWGARSTLLIGVLVTALSTALSWTIGLASGLWRRAEGPLLGLTDLLLALPSIPLYLLIVAAAGPSRRNVVLTLGLLSWPAFARIVRAQTLALRGQPYVEAARAMGAGDVRVIGRHILPNVISSALVYAMADIILYIVLAASLSYLGLGARPPAPEWGAMITEGRTFLGSAWWMSAFPGLAIVVTGIAFSIFGDGLADALRPSRR